MFSEEALQDTGLRSTGALSGVAPQPEGPQEVRERFEDLNRPKPWDLPGQLGRFLGRLNLKAGATVLVAAELLSSVARDFIESLTGLSYPGWIAFVLPVLLAFFHRRERGKDSEAVSGELPGAASTPKAISEAVAGSRRSLPRKLYDRVRETLDTEG